SHHRVHHAINDIYLDKNYSQIFIFWDKWFGTFQEELPDVPAVYGVKRPVSTYNPILINFQHFWQILKDAIRTKSWSDKILIWVKPTGYRPHDVEASDPLFSISDPYSYQKYDPKASTILHIWSWIQMLLTLVLMLHMFSIIDQYPLPQLVWYGLFLFITIFGYTSVMDLKKYSLFTGLFRLAMVTIHQYYFETWFSIPIAVMYLLIAITLCTDFLLLKKEFTENSAL
ncbi:MAG TPA: sterol desaturase, partial [Saprospiraceae bacterium]|nr:sterol desaturase [Saprospiraceae bacterium]